MSFRLVDVLPVYVWHHPVMTLMSVEIVIIISGTNPQITTLAHYTPFGHRRLHCTVISNYPPD